MKIGSIPALKSSEVIDVRLRDQWLKEVTTAKYLWVHVDSALSWNDHLTKLCTEIYPKLCFLNRLSHFLSHETLLKIYKQTILPAIDYRSIIWIDCSKVMSDKLERLQNQALRSILKKDRKTCTHWLCEKCHLLSLKNRRRFLCFQLVFKIVKRHNCPENYLATRASLGLRSLRDDSLLNIPAARSTMGQKTLQYSAVKDWKRLPEEFRDITNFKYFKTELFKYLFLILTKLVISAQ